MPWRHNLRLMDLRHLRTFVTVAEQGTVSKAALRLGIAQPALSRQIADLETELGIKLFDRIRRRLVLTGEGAQILSESRTILSSVSALGERAQLLRRADAGVLKVAATPQTLEGVFTNFLHHYARRRPNVRIKLSEAVGGALLPLLERGDIHLGISMLQLIRSDSHSFETLMLAPIDLLAASSATHKFAGTGSMDIRSLGSRPLLLLDSSFFVRTSFDAACQMAGFKPTVFLESRAPHVLLALAEAGHGVAIVPSVLPTDRYKLKISRLTYLRKPLRETLSIVWDKRLALPACAEDFCQSLRSYVREAFPVTRPSRRAR
jgi:LysR family nitrogen assimilation transcriptional regulator